ncbi:MAG: AAA family ATPase, partial [Bacteroidota bacterium]
MLIDFTVSNFRSIKEPQTLSMLATSAKENPDNVFKVDDKISLLKTSVIYGANGSGKSNLVKALEDMAYFVHLSTDHKKGERIEYYQPFKLDKSYVIKPITFELEFLGSDNIRYRYTFSFTEF